MDENELFDQLRNLRTATSAAGPAAHKPLLLLWLFGRYVKTGSTEVTYADAEEPVGQLIDEFGPANRRSQPDRTAMPFVYLERTLWLLEDDGGKPIPPTPSLSGGWLRNNGARGRLRPEVEELLALPGKIATAAKLLIDTYLDKGEVNRIVNAAGLRRAYRVSARALARSTAATRAVNALVDAPDDYDSRFRRHAFEWLAELSEEHGGRVPFGLLQEFRFEGKRIALMDQQAGIRKPKELKAALSLRTTYTPPNKQRPYEDELDENGLLRYYMYRGTDPQHHHNVAMRRAFTENRPMIWFKGVASGLYQPHFPLRLTKDEPENLRFLTRFE